VEGAYREPKFRGLLQKIYESYNPLVLEFVWKYSGPSGQQIRAKPKWPAAAARKPKHFDESGGEVTEQTELTRIALT